MTDDEEKHQHSHDEPIVYTIADVSRILKISDDVTRELVRNGELPSKRVGRQYRITKEALEAYINNK